MHLEDILAQCLSLPGVSLTHDDHHATLRLVTEDGHGTIDFHVQNDQEGRYGHSAADAVCKAERG